jgi:hypothetical protein
MTAASDRCVTDIYPSVKSWTNKKPRQSALDMIHL